MKRIFTLVFGAIVALTSCHKGDFESPEAPLNDITLSFSIEENSVVQTKVQSADESTLNNLWAFVFSSSGILVEKQKVVNLDNAKKTGDVCFQNGSGLNLYICANVSYSQETQFNGLTMGVSTSAQLKAILNDLSLLRTPGLPMWGELLNQTISSSTTKISFNLVRSCARIDIVANSVPDFIFAGIEKLLNVASSAPIGSSLLPVVASSVTSIIPTDNTLSTIYLYENGIYAPNEATAESKATAVIVKGLYKNVEGYYKLRLKYDIAPVKYDINRNTLYSIKITSVKAPGFATVAEAEASYPQNIDYNVVVNDSNATDLITSNGQYYLGTTNSDYLVYAQGPQNDLVVATISHNLPSTITNGTITAMGIGLTLKTSSISTATTKQDVIVDISSSFTSGSLTLRLGNLMKVININRKTNVTFSDVLINDFGGGIYILGELDNPTPTWFKMGATNTRGELVPKVQSPNGGIWLYVANNVAPSAVTRQEGGYVSSTYGRSKVCIIQPSAKLKYVSGAPESSILGVNPAAFVLTVNTELAGWTVKAYEGNKGDKSKPVTLTLGIKTGSPVIGSSVNCTVPVTVPTSPVEQRKVQLYLSCSEVPGAEIWFATVEQKHIEPLISLDITSQAEIPFGGGTCFVKVTSNFPWTTTGNGAAATPVSGVSGSNQTVQIVTATYTGAYYNFVNVTFSCSNGFSSKSVTWNGTQLGDGVIPRSVMKAAGWPEDLLPAYGLQIALRGNVLPGVGAFPGNESALAFRSSDTYPVSCTNTYYGGGLSNTNTLSGTGYPAITCINLGVGWHLPASLELSFIYKNQSYISNSFRYLSNDYWSSTDSGFSQYYINFTDGKLYSSPRTNIKYTRCVRMF